jgi:dimethylargininase
LISLPDAPDLPDAVFVEDPAVVLDEVAIISNMGAASRRPEAASLAETLAPYRPLKFLREPATLDGGDVMRVERSIFVGLSQRTNREAVSQLSDILQPYGYEVTPVAVKNCLHLKSACSYLGDGIILINRSMIDAEPLRAFTWLDVPDEEPAGANALLIDEVVILPASFPRTRDRLEKRGCWRQVRALDLSELQKAEAGVTCTSLIFKDEVDGDERATR